MKEGTLMLLDRHRQLMVQTTRSKNRLYKVVLEADTTHCLLTTKATESGKWHARQGHVNTETMKLMINKELVTGVPRIMVEKETYLRSVLVWEANKTIFPSINLFPSQRTTRINTWRSLWSYHTVNPRTQKICICTN